MAYLSYRDDQLRSALERFSPQRQLLFGLSLGERLIALHAITAPSDTLRAALDAIWERLLSGQPDTGGLPGFSAAIEELQRQTSTLTKASESIAQECRHALLILLETAESPVNRLEDILTVLRLSREAVELLAFENMRLVSWDKWADEKTRIHPLVQGELNAIFNDLKMIWDFSDDCAGYARFRDRFKD